MYLELDVNFINVQGKIFNFSNRLLSLLEFSEQFDMLLVLVFCEGNRSRNVEEYMRVSNHVIPPKEAFSNFERRVTEKGKFLVLLQ